MWFDGKVEDAIAKAKENNSILLVFISVADEENKTKELDTAESAFREPEVLAACQKYKLVPLRLFRESTAAKQFAEFYPVVCVPIVFLIDENGVSLEIVAAKVTKENILESIQKAVTMLALSEATAPQSVENEAPVAKIEVTTQSDKIEDAPGEIEEPLAKNDEAVPIQLEEAAGPRADLSLEDKIQRAQMLLEARQEEKTKLAEQEAKEQELKRREEGKQMQQIKERGTELEMKELTEQRKKQKANDKEALRRVKEQIAQDRADKAARFQQRRQEEVDLRAEEKQKKEAEAAEKRRAEEIAKSSEARVQFRLPDGSSRAQRFPADSQFSTAFQFISTETNFSSKFHLIQLYPRREFTEANMQMSYRELELVPTAVLLVMPESGRLGGGIVQKGLMGRLLEGVTNIVRVPVQFVYRMFLSLFGWDAPRPAVTNTSTGGNEGRFGRLKSGERGEGDDMGTWNGNSTEQL